MTQVEGPDIADPNRTRPGPSSSTLGREGYRTLADFRYLLRRFLEFSESAAIRAGLTPRQHQALLAVKGFAPGGFAPGGSAPGDFTAQPGPTVGELAERLCIRHHSAVELVDRLVEAGLCTRAHDPEDRRRVMLRLTETAESHLAGLSAIHLEELRALRPALLEILDRLDRPPPARAVNPPRSSIGLDPTCRTQAGAVRS